MTGILDIGNSRVKFALFQSGKLLSVTPFSHTEFPTAFPAHLETENLLEKIQYLGCASVGNKDILKASQAVACALPQASWLVIDHRTPLPVTNDYSNPKTLGMDRICACVGGRQKALEGPLLVIDAGTAITYDFLDGDNHYQGGGIAPGLRLRFKALNDHTAALPLVQADGKPALIGNSTVESIRSGVINGLLAEIEGTVTRYRQHAGTELKVFLTGGDAEFLGNHLKNINFVAPELLLHGIHAVIQYQYSHG